MSVVGLRVALMTTTSTVRPDEQAVTSLLGAGVDAVRHAEIGSLAGVLSSLDEDALQTMSAEQAEVVVAATQRVANVMAAIQAEAVTTYADATRRRQDELEREHRADFESRRDAARARGVPFRERWHPVPGADGFAAAALAPLLHVSPRTMATRIGRARRLVCHLPALTSLARAGRLEPWRCDAVVRASEVLDVAHLEELETRVLAAPVDDLSFSELARRARRAAAATDPEGVDETCRRARARRGVRCGPDPDLPGLTLWQLRLPSDVSATVWRAVDELAREYVAARREAGDPVTLDQARADALGDLVLGQAQVTTTLDLVVPVAAVTAGEFGSDVGAGEGVTAGVYRPAERLSPSEVLSRDGQTDPLLLSWVEGHDLHLASVVEAELALRLMGHLEVLGNPHLSNRPPPDPVGAGGLLDVPLPSCSSGTARPRGATPPPDAARPSDPAPPTWFVPGLVDAGRTGALLPTDIGRLLADPDVRVRLLGSHPESGAVVTDATTAYRPGQTLARRVRRRDGVCRFPGCGTPAERCQLDHVQPWPDGRTEETNLVALCTSHHGFKHHAGWRLGMDEQGVCTWTAPTGWRHVTRPVAVHDPAT